MKTVVSGAGQAEVREDVAAFETMTRVLVGITLASLEVLEGAVSLAQFRLLLVLDGLGRVPSSRLASELGLGASSVTRLADRMETAGLLERGAHERSRSIVTVQVTEAGRELVARVIARRHELLADLLDRMPPDEREALVTAANSLTGLAADAAALGVTGPLPL